MCNDQSLGKYLLLVLFPIFKKLLVILILGLWVIHIYHFLVFLFSPLLVTLATQEFDKLRIG